MIPIRQTEIREIATRAKVSLSPRCCFSDVLFATAAVVGRGAELEAFALSTRDASPTSGARRRPWRTGTLSIRLANQQQPRISAPHLT